MAAGIVLAGAALLALAAFTTASRADAVMVSHGISTFGDLKYPADFKHLDYVNPDAPKGGEISEWTMGGFDSMNPFTVKGLAGALSTVMLEPIMTGTSDEIGSAYCLVCATIEYPESRDWVIFNLRPEAKFSDGTPLTADDVMFSYQTLLEKGLSDFRTVLAQQVEGAEVLDPHRIKFTFKPDFPKRDLIQEVGGLPVLSKAQFERDKLDLESATLTPYIGSGPYMFDRMEVGRTLVYKRNPDYWGATLPINVGRSNFDTIRLEYFADSAAAFEAFKSGVYTFRNENSAKQWSTAYDFPAITKGYAVKAELHSGAKASGQAFLINLRREKFQDPRVREAVGLMFNFEWSNQTLFYGLYDRVESIWENTWMEAKGTPGPEEIAVLQPLVDAKLLPASILTDEAVLAPVSGARQLDRGNLRRASALLDAAGWEVGADGLRRNAKGEVLRIELLNDDSAFDRVINPFVENLRALGIDAANVKVDPAQMENRTRPPNYDFDLITGNARSTYISGAELKQFFGGATADDSAFNLMGLKSPAVDKLIDQAIAAKTRDELTYITMALDRVLRAERFWIPQWYKASHTVAYYDLFGHPEALPDYALGEMDFWWYDAEKAARLKAEGAIR
nr:extracellular solute-binding protein [Gemmobacter serpentinus]